MTMQKGRDLLIKVSGGTEVASYITVAAARTTSFSINNNAFDITSMNSNGFQELQAEGGVQSLEIKLDGIFKDSASEEIIRQTAFLRDIRSYQLCFPNNDTIKSNFVVASYKREGTYNGLETFSLALKSSGSYEFNKG